MGSIPTGSFNLFVGYGGTSPREWLEGVGNESAGKAPPFVHAVVAQMEEHQVPSLKVVGSSPTYRTMLSQGVSGLKHRGHGVERRRLLLMDNLPYGIHRPLVLRGRCWHFAGVAQLAERQPSKLDVAGSKPVARTRPRSSAA